jgi:hypothetical protein
VLEAAHAGFSAGQVPLLNFGRESPRTSSFLTNDWGSFASLKMTRQPRNDASEAPFPISLKFHIVRCIFLVLTRIPEPCYKSLPSRFAAVLIREPNARGGHGVMPPTAFGSNREPRDYRSKKSGHGFSLGLSGKF